MRLQLIFTALLLSLHLLAQDDAAPDTTSVKNFSEEKRKAVDVDFMFNYYNQDGDHSAVTGGRGTEKLEDYASKIIVNVPLPANSEVKFNIHVNYYTSASTDRIDENRSSASRKDIHAQIEQEYTRFHPQKKRTLGFLAGGAIESDYLSGFVGGKWAKQSKDANREFEIKAVAFFDALQLIFPDELRDSAYLDAATNKRRTFSCLFTYSQVFTKKMMAAVSSDFIYQNGLLSTPFHRVYFKGSPKARIEKLPLHRVKFPLAIRVNYFPAKWLVTRFYYRFYYDNFGIIANTFSIELPFKIKSVFSISPFYRLYHQTAAEYFREYGEHEPDALYYSSDYDLSEFLNHKIGIELVYSPRPRMAKPEGEKKLKLGNAGLRYANYFRSDGLRSFLVSFQLGIKI